MKSASKFIVLGIAIASATLLFQNCAGGGDGGGSAPSIQSNANPVAPPPTNPPTSPPVVGVDLSGTWLLAGVQCYNLSSLTVTNEATFTNGYSDTLIVNGNSFAETFSQGNCVVQFSGNIVFQTTTMSSSNLQPATVTNSPCTLSASLTNSAIAPTNSSTVAYTGEIVTGFSNLPYAYDLQISPAQVWAPSPYSDGSSDSCYKVYQKQ